MITKYNLETTYFRYLVPFIFTKILRSDMTAPLSNHCRSIFFWQQKQLFADILKKRCFWKLCKIYKKKPVVEPETCNFIKKRIQHRCFPVNFAKIFRTYFRISSDDCSHCVKSVQMRSFFWSTRLWSKTQTFSWFANSVNLRIQSEYGKIRIRKKSVFGIFSHSVCRKHSPD